MDWRVKISISFTSLYLVTTLHVTSVVLYRCRLHWVFKYKDEGINNIAGAAYVA